MACLDGLAEFDRFKIFDPEADLFGMSGRSRAWVLGATLLAGTVLMGPALGLGGLLGPLVEPLEPVIEPVGELLEPVADEVSPLLDPLLAPTEGILSPVTDPLLSPVAEELAGEGNGATPPTTTTQPVRAVTGEAAETPDLPTPGEQQPAEQAPSARADRTTANPVRTDEAATVGQRAEVESSRQLDASSLLLIAETPVTPSPASSTLLADVLEWVGNGSLDSVLGAPWLALQVLLRALASAGQGLLAPVTLLIGLATLMARERRLLGTKSA